MHGCFFRFGSPRRQRSLHGGVTVVSRGGGDGVRAKVVMSRTELERIAAAVARRQCGGAAVACRRRITLLERQQPAGAPPRSEPEDAGAARRGDSWQPGLDGIPEDA